MSCVLSKWKRESNGGIVQQISNISQAPRQTRVILESLIAGVLSFFIARGNECFQDKLAYSPCRAAGHIHSHRSFTQPGRLLLHQSWRQNIAKGRKSFELQPLLSLERSSTRFTGCINLQKSFTYTGDLSFCSPSLFC